MIALALIAATLFTDPSSKPVCGIDPATGKCVPVKVAADGTVAVSGAAGGGGGGATFSNDGTAAVLGRALDTDTGAGTHWTPEVILVTPGAGGPTQTGTAAIPLRTDPTGATTQPVSGTVNVGNLPATQPVSGTVTANVGTTNGLALDATLTGGTQKTKLTDGTLNLPLLNAAPASDTGQVALPVRVISQLGAGGGGGASSVSINDGVTSTTKATVRAGGSVPDATADSALVVSDRDAIPVTATGTFALTGDAVTLNVASAASTIAVEVEGTFTGGFRFDRSFDGTTFLQGGLFSLSSGTTASIPSTAGQYVAAAYGAQVVRLSAVAWTSGTATVTIRASAGLSTILVSNNTMKISDPAGTTVMTVRGGSSLPTSADSASVVTMRDPVSLATGASVGIADATGDAANVEPLSHSLHVTPLPHDFLGCYTVSTSTSTYSGLAAGSTMFSMRWTDATKIAVVYRFSVSMAATVAASAAGLADRELVFARSFTASDSGGTTITLSGGQGRHRSSMPASAMGDMRVMTTSALTAGTRVLDATGMGILGTTQTTAAITTAINGQLLPKNDLYNAANGGAVESPIVLAQNEGLIMRMKSAEPTSATMASYIEVVWCEAANASSYP